MNPSLYIFVLEQITSAQQAPTNFPFWDFVLVIGMQTLVLAAFLGRLFQRVDGLSETQVRHAQDIDDLCDGQNDLKVASVQLSTIVASKLSNPHPDPTIHEVINRFKEVGAKRRRDLGTT